MKNVRKFASAADHTSQSRQKSSIIVDVRRCAPRTHPSFFPVLHLHAVQRASARDVSVPI